MGLNGEGVILPSSSESDPCIVQYEALQISIRQAIEPYPVIHNQVTLYDAHYVKD